MTPFIVGCDRNVLQWPSQIFFSQLTQFSFLSLAVIFHVSKEDNPEIKHICPNATEFNFKCYFLMGCDCDKTKSCNKKVARTWRTVYTFILCLLKNIISYISPQGFELHRDSLEERNLTMRLNSFLFIEWIVGGC